MPLFSQTAEYALRAATHVAQHSSDGHVMAREVAGATRIPAKYLQKIMRDLVRAGILKSTRGCGGGFRMARSPRRVRLAHIIAPFDPLTEQTRCPFGNRRCGKANPCPAHTRWEKVRAVHDEFLHKTTLADLIED